jgi:mannose-binding lectin 2
VEFDFRIYGKNAHIYGDGFAFWFTTDKYKPGSVFGSADRFTGLGIFFDTFANLEHEHTFPYISAMIGDGHKEYDHDGDNQKSIAGHGCEANIRANEDLLKARVTYFKNHMLEVGFRSIIL